MVTLANTPGDTVERLHKFLGMDPTNRTLRAQLVRDASNAQRWDLARQACADGLQQDAKWAELWAHLGYIELATGRINESVQAFQRAIELGANDPVILFNYAQAQFFAGDYVAAKTQLSIPELQEGPLAKDATLCYVRCLHYLGEYADAITAAQTFLSKQDDAELKGVLALVLYDADQNREAEQTADDALRVNELQHEARLAHGGVCFESGRYQEAKFDYDMALKSNAKSGRAWSGKAQIEFNDFQFDDALQSLQEAVRYMPNHIGTWHLVAWIHLLRKDVDAAAFAVDKAMELDRNFGESHGALAAVQVLQGKIDEARASIKRAQRLNPLGFAAYYAQMLLLEADGKGEEAKQLVESIMKTPHLNLGTTPEELVKKRLLELSKGMTKH